MNLPLLAAANSAGLRVFFSFMLLLVLAAGIVIFRSRKKLFSHKGDASDSYASANLRMVMIILVWIHALILTAVMIFEV